MTSEAAEATQNRPTRSVWIRAGVLMALAAFFLYRYLSIGSAVYLVLVILLLGLGILAVWGMLTSRLQSLAMNLAISLVFLDLVFYRVDFRGMIRAVGDLNYLFLIPSTLLVVLSFVVRAIRWGWLLRQSKVVPFMSLLAGLSIGIAANMVLPARAGEFIRAFVLGRREGLSKTTVFATVVLERIFDGLTILLSLLLVILIIGVRSPEIQYMGLAGAAFYVGAIVAMIVVYFQKRWLEGWIARLLPRSLSERLVALLDSFVSGLESIRNWRQLTMITVLSLVTWVIIAASFWPVLQAFNFGPAVPLYTPFLLIATLGLALMIPAAPAGIGVFQYVCLLTLRLVFAPYATALVTGFDERAVAFSLVVHLSQAVPEVLMGFIFFLFEGLSLQEVQADL